MAANRLPASWMNALDPAAGARRSRWTAARAGAPRCPCISRCSRPASGQTLIVPSSFGRGELPRRLRAPFARNVIPGAHAVDRARGRSRCRADAIISLELLRSKLGDLDLDDLSPRQSRVLWAVSESARLLESDNEIAALL